MDPEERRIVASVTDSIVRLLRGEVLDTSSLSLWKGDDELEALCESTERLLRTFAQAKDFISSLSKGILEVEPPPRNFLISPFKALHSNLSHLTWQTQRVAMGDLSQRVDFLGEFSEAFNSMIASLKEKRRMEEELRTVHAELMEANTRVMDSIQYARNIQAAFLPNVKELQSQLSDFFVTWKPKDVIGGDIYRFKPVADGCVLAVIDCTGHGVPGAIMTMIAGSSFDIAMEGGAYREPSLMLQRMNWLVKTALNQHHQESPSDDGMDIGICFVDKSKRIVTFAGARIGLFHALDGTVHEVLPDRRSVGYKSSDPSYTFKEHVIATAKGTRFYMATDGMTDQLGGPSELPFGKKRFKRLLAEHCRKELSEQKTLFEGAFDEYRGEEIQLDDVTVLGFVVD